MPDSNERRGKIVQKTMVILGGIITQSRVHEKDWAKQVEQALAAALDEYAEGLRAENEKFKREVFYALDRLDWAFGYHDERHSEGTMKCQMCMIRDRLRAILRGKIPGRLPQRILDALAAMQAEDGGEG